MRNAVLIALLALPLAASAQTAADSTLVERFSEAARLGLAAEAALWILDEVPLTDGLLDEVFAEFTPETYLASIHTAFYRDFRPDDLQAAITAYESPQFELILDFERSMGASLSELTAELEAIMANPDAYDLADETLARDFIVATRTTENMVGMMEVMMPRMLRHFPGIEDEAAAMGMTVDEMVHENILSPLVPQIESTFLIATRYSLRDVPESDIRFVNAFYGSPAGVYVNRTMYEGGMDAVVPVIDRMSEMMAGLFQEMGATPPPPCKKGTPGCEVPPPPPPPARD